VDGIFELISIHRGRSNSSVPFKRHNIYSTWLCKSCEQAVCCDYGMCRFLITCLSLDTVQNQWSCVHILSNMHFDTVQPNVEVGRHFVFRKCWVQISAWM